MRRVVVTGLGIVSCIGNNKIEVLDSLLNTKSGIVFSEEHKKYNFRSQVIGTIKNLNLDEHIDRKQKRFMGEGSAFNFIALKEAIKESGLEEKDISNEKTGIVMGSGGPSIKNVVYAVDTTRKSAPKRMGPYIVPRTMASTCSATLAVPLKIKGVNYSISSACATSGHCIGNGMELIQLGKQDIIFAGGGEELDWALSSMFDAMPALSSKFNDTPEKASRPYDANRDGFVIAGGGGAIVLEEYEHAKARGAKIYAELTGYGATSDGYDMVQPSGEGATRCMNIALKTTRNKVDYINSHGTSTPIGDTKELEAIKETFKENIPKISSTKSLTGHSLGATSVQEAIYCLLMMKNKFISASANIENMDEKAKNFPIVTKVEKDKELNCVMSNSFGFGGTNATLVFEKLN
jgi:3-oxoacyl-[acyl-carrier-protein] synthase-1